MQIKLTSLGFFPFLLALAALTSACGEQPAQEGCPAEDEIRGACAGVPAKALCEGDSCTEGVDCADVISASDDASLSAALSSAGAGTCVALAPGSYGAVSLPGGARLLGRSAADVQVKAITVAAGKGSLVRGLSVGAGGVKLAPGANLQVEAVRVAGATGPGISAPSDAVVTVRSSVIGGGAGSGLAAGDGGTITVEDSILEDNEGPGLVAACSADCDCPSPPDLVLRRTIVRANHVGGVVLFGAHALLESVDIQGTLVGDDVAFGLGGGGLSAASCSDVTAKDLHVFNNRAYGILLDDSSATIGDPGTPLGIQISGNEIGVWAQHISQSHPQTVRLDGLDVKSNAGVGIGTSGDAVGLIICKSAIADTSLADVLVEGGGEQQVGDGLLWLGGSEIAVDDLSLSGNARASVVIDGEATGSLTNVTLSGGDEAKGVVQQKYAGGAQPQVGAGAPAITTSADGLFAIPLPPSLPPKSL